MDERKAAVEALRALRDQFSAGHGKYPNLHHAIMEGWAVHDHPWSREMIKAMIACGQEFEEYGGKLSSPHGFYFGSDLTGLRLFDITASTVLDIIIDNTGVPRFGLLGPDVNDEDWGNGHILLRILYKLMDSTDHPLKPTKGLITIEPDPLAPARNWICVPGAASMYEVPSGWDYGDGTAREDQFEYTLQDVRDSAFEEVIVNQTSVYMFAQLGLGLILEIIETTRSVTAGSSGAKRMTTLQASKVLECSKDIVQKRLTNAGAQRHKCAGRANAYEYDLNDIINAFSDDARYADGIKRLRSA